MRNPENGKDYDVVWLLVKPGEDLCAGCAFDGFGRLCGAAPPCAQDHEDPAKRFCIYVRKRES